VTDKPDQPASLRDLAMATLASVAADQTASPAARATAARTILEAYQVVGAKAKPLADGPPDPETMTADQLDQLSDPAGTVDPFS